MIIRGWCTTCFAHWWDRTVNGYVALDGFTILSIRPTSYGLLLTGECLSCRTRCFYPEGVGHEQAQEGGSPVHAR